MEQQANGTKTKPDSEPKEITPLEKYLMAVVVLSAFVPMVALLFLPLATE